MGGVLRILMYTPNPIFQLNNSRKEPYQFRRVDPDKPIFELSFDFTPHMTCIVIPVTNITTKLSTNNCMIDTFFRPRDFDNQYHNTNDTGGTIRSSRIGQTLQP